MKKHIAAITISLLFCAGAAFAQDGRKPQLNNCRVSSEQLPSIRGLRIGMSVQQLLLLFPGSSDEPAIKQALANADGAPNYGLIRLNFYPEKYAAPPQFSGVSGVGVDLFDGRAQRFVISYAGQAGKNPWTNINQFLEKVINAYKLPGMDQWHELDDDEGGVKVLKCEGVQISVSTANSCCPSIEVQGPDPRPQVKARQEAEMKKMRDAFVP